MTFWPFPKIIDGSKCSCPCHRCLGQEWVGGVAKDDPIHALTACSACSRFHRIAFIRKKRKPPKEDAPDTFDSGEEGG